MSPMIDIRGLRKEFGNFVAVENVSFSLERGEVLGFLGPNGAGKSTTMKMVTGFLPPTKGTALIGGHDILQEPMKAKEKIGYLPEGAPAYPDMTPETFLKFIAEIRGFRGKAAEKKVEEVAHRTSLDSHFRVPIESLSKGYKRRVGLAQAIIHDPEVLVMDEPTDGLDPNQKHEVRNLISAMGKNKAIILSTHILEEVEAVCTRAIIIAAGQVIADGTPDELCSRSPFHNAVLIRMKQGGGSDVKSTLERLTGVRRVEDLGTQGNGATYRLFPEKGRLILSEVNQCSREKNWDVAEVRVERGRLDEVFRDLTAETTINAKRET